MRPNLNYQVVPLFNMSLLKVALLFLHLSQGSAVGSSVPNISLSVRSTERLKNFEQYLEKLNRQQELKPLKQLEQLEQLELSEQRQQLQTFKQLEPLKQPKPTEHLQQHQPLKLLDLLGGAGCSSTAQYFNVLYFNQNFF